MVELVEIVEMSSWMVDLVVVVTTSFQSCKVPTGFLTRLGVAEAVTYSGSAELKRSVVHTIEERMVELELVLVHEVQVGCAAAQENGSDPNPP